MAEFLLDHNVARDLADHLRQAGHGARTSHALGMERDGDEAYLSRSAQAAWILITHNAKDFVLLHAAWRRWTAEWGVSVEHAGILVLIPPVASAQAAQEVLSLLRANSPLPNALYLWRRSRGWARQP